VCVCVCVCVARSTADLSKELDPEERTKSFKYGKELVRGASPASRGLRYCAVVALQPTRVFRPRCRSSL
jgi:hypothetical protein